jgi:transcriptional regulator with XRE-family HTH domain
MAIPAEKVFRKIMTPGQRAEAARRAAERAELYVTLQALRKARELTQVQLANILGKNQVAISQIEKRTDMLLSTLRSYVQAMGGNLSIVVQFPDREPVILAGLDDDEPAAAPRAIRAKIERPKQPSPA